MGRLFWKFFLSIWLAQVVAVLSISGGIWIKNRNHALRTEGIELGPPARFMLDAAEVAHRYGGTAGLRDLLQQNRRHPIFALDDQGKDLLGRDVAAETVQTLREMRAHGEHADAVRSLPEAGGSGWLVYVARRDAPPDGFAPPPGERPPPQHRAMPPGSPHFPFVAMLLAMLASLVSAVLLAWHFAKPIRHLRGAFDAAASGKLDTRIGPAMGGRRDELSDLGRDFDRMASQLQASMDSQRRLLHDVSHELRSPLARLQVAIGLARQRPEKAGASLDRIELESMRMNALIGSLLTLSRLENGVEGNMDEEVNLSELAADIAEDARFEAQAAGKDVEFYDAGIAIVRGNAELLHSAIENVVRNAVRHTAPGSRVEVTVALQRLSHDALIAVRDYGPGVPEAELDAIFRPFVQSSTASRSAEGYGLGLAIARQVVKAHGGEIEAANAKDGGLRVEIHLPVPFVPGS
ncbi:HAMP domain-containing protein [Herbaspirillum sp. HC18]|nr:HAMP domain-containing protein [Herbaspirillum sp. HC18]